jgi:hypothetical protein
MFRKKPFQALVLAAVLLLILGFSEVHYVRKEAWGWLFWNSQKAYVFIGVNDRGYRLSCLGLVVEAVREIFPFGAAAPTDKHFSLLVLEISSSSVQRYSMDNFWLTSITPFDGSLYTANSLPGGTVVKWAGDRFELATPEEKATLQLAGQHDRVPPGPSYDNVEGWSKRTVAGEIVSQSTTESTEKDSKVTLELGGQQLTFVMNSGFISREAYVDLIRPGRPAERIWYLDEDSHRVTKADYDKIFGSR